MNNVFDIIKLKLNENKNKNIEVWRYNLVAKCYEHWMYSIVEKEKNASREF